MGIAIRKEGFVTVGAIVLDIVDVMIANGFTPQFPMNNGSYEKPSINPGVDEKFRIVLEASGAVDPLNKSDVTKKQPWRVAFDVTDNATLGIIAGSATALPDSGQLPFTTTVITESSSTIVRVTGAKGIVGANYTPFRSSVTASPVFYESPATFQPHWLQKTQGFVNRRNKVWVGATMTQSGPTESPPKFPTDPKNDVSNTYPLSYQLCITDRGVFLSIWQGTASNMDGLDYSWMVIQRPVERDTGETVVTGKAPVFCVNSVGGQINRFVVREEDVTDASKIILGAVDTVDGTAIINDKKQVGVSENNQYIVNYPSRLNTPRYAYTYELDMIGYASATVISPTTSVPQRLYEETEDRSYVGMHANQSGNNGMRIMALESGGGI